MGHKVKSEIKVIQGGNQMSLIRDTEEVMKFLEFANRKSILNEQAINCRLTACNNLFAVLNEDEDNLDFILANLDMLVNRFRNRNNNVRASTLKVYKSRVKSSLEDFKAWSSDPFAWERGVTDKARSAGMGKPSDKKGKTESKPSQTAKKNAKETIEETVEEETPVTSLLPGTRKVSFPVRADFSVEMVIPAEGLTLKELHRLGLFLYPYCNDLDPETSRWPQLGH